MSVPVPIDFDLNRTLQELEGEDWGEPSGDDTRLVVTCHNLRRKPLRDFTAEDLRILIGQNICLPILLPMAAVVLEASPLANGDFYEGDLLVAVTSSNLQDYKAWKLLAARLAQVAARALVAIDLGEVVTTAEIRQLIETGLLKMSSLRENV